MTSMTHARPRSPLPMPRPRLQVGLRFMNTLASLRRRLRERAARRALMALDDRLLGDIGLTRADLTRDLDELASEAESRRTANLRPVPGTMMEIEP